MIAAARSLGREPEIVFVEVPPGMRLPSWLDLARVGAEPARTIRVGPLSTHCMSSEARYHPTKISYIYNRYKRRRYGDGRELFPGALAGGRLSRTSWLDDYMRQGSAAGDVSTSRDRSAS